MWNWLTLLLLIAGLLAYANGSAWRYARRLQRLDLIGGAGEAAAQLSRSHLWVLGICLGWAAMERIGPRELGLGWQGLVRSAAWGAVVGTVGSVLIHTFFALPLVNRLFAPPPEWAGIERQRLGRMMVGPMLVGSALFEEVAFRGLLHAKLERVLHPRWALVAGGAIFAAWHLVITWCNLSRSDLPRRLAPILYGGSLAVLFAVGLFLGLLRQATGHIIGGVLAHWLLLVSVATALVRTRRGAPGPD